MSTGWLVPVSLSGSTSAATSESPLCRSRRISMRTRLRRSSLPGLVVLALGPAAVICGWCMMPNAEGRRRRFGAVRRLPSGRYQARYLSPDGVTRPADDTFDTKTEAEVWLARKEAEIFDGDWIAP